MIQDQSLSEQILQVDDQKYQKIFERHLSIVFAYRFTILKLKYELILLIDEFIDNFLAIDYALLCTIMMDNYS